MLIQNVFTHLHVCLSTSPPDCELLEGRDKGPAA